MQATVRNGLRLPPNRSQQVCSNNSRDCRLKSQQLSLKSSAHRVNSPLLQHPCNEVQQMCRIQLPPPPTRIINCLRMLTRNSMRSSTSYLVLRQQHGKTLNAVSVISTTYPTERENGIQHTNDDLLALRKGLVSLSCAPSCHNLNVHSDK